MQSDTIDTKGVLYNLNILDVNKQSADKEIMDLVQQGGEEVPVCSATLFSVCAWAACVHSVHVFCNIVQRCATLYSVRGQTTPAAPCLEELLCLAATTYLSRSGLLWAKLDIEK